MAGNGLIARRKSLLATLLPVVAAILYHTLGTQWYALTSQN